jgi:sulfur-carrier protein
VRVSVALPGALRPYARGQAEVAVDVPDGTTVDGLLDRLAVSEPALERRLRDERGLLRRHVNVYLGDEDVRTGGLLGQPLRDGDRVLVLPSVAGG